MPGGGLEPPRPCGLRILSASSRCNIQSIEAWRDTFSAISKNGVCKLFILKIIRIPRQKPILEQIFAYDLRLLMRASSFGEKAGGSRKQELIDFEGDKIDYVSCVTIKRLQICEVRGNKSWSHSKQKSYNMASCNEVVVHRIDATSADDKSSGHTFVATKL